MNLPLCEIPEWIQGVWFVFLLFLVSGLQSGKPVSQTCLRLHSKEESWNQSPLCQVVIESAKDDNKNDKYSCLLDECYCYRFFFINFLSFTFRYFLSSANISISGIFCKETALALKMKKKRKIKCLFIFSKSSLYFIYVSNPIKHFWRSFYHWVLTTTVRKENMSPTHSPRSTYRMTTARKVTTQIIWIH